MKVGSLFSGIGGLDLGLERAGMDVVWQSEIDPYASRVLAKHWPDVPNLGDITTIDWSTVEPVDLICGGYPCQPFSLAGARGGATDARHLWPYFADAIRLLRPEWALLENVPGHLSLGFGQVLGDLAGLGYDTEWDCIPAAAVGAPHLRYRIFVVAHTGEVGSTLTDTDSDTLRQQSIRIRRGISQVVVGVDGENRDVADPDNTGCQQQRRPESASSELAATQRGGDVADTDNLGLQGCDNPRSSEGLGPARHEPARSSGSIGDTWTVEPAVGRVAHGIPCRVDRLRALGNAVVPQVAEYIGNLIINASLHRDQHAAEQGVLIRVTNEPCCDIDEGVADVDGELVAGGVAVNGDGDDVSHPPHNDYSTTKVKDQT